MDEKTSEIGVITSVKKQSEVKREAVSIRSLFRYGTCIELFYLFISIIASAVYGVSFPLALVIFGDSINSYIERTTHLCSLNLTSLSEEYCPPNITLTSVNFYATVPFCDFNGSNLTNIDYDLNEATRRPLIMSIITGCTCLLAAYVRVAFSNVSAERQIRTIRKKLFRSILEKDIAFFDQHKTGELTVQLTDNINKICNGIGDRLTGATEMMATFISCFVVGFTRGWKLSFVVLSVTPLIFIPIIVFFKLTKKMTAIELEAYGKAGVIAEEVISSIRTVLSYNGQEKEIQRYKGHLDNARKSGIKKSLIGGIRLGVTYFLIFSLYALGFWYGTKLVWEEDYTIGTVFTVFISINFGTLYLAEASPHFQAIYDARVAAFTIWKIISEPITINKNSNKGLTKNDLIGHIRFSNVHFSYPSRSDVPILINLSFDVQSGETIALVGSSGSGKSTCAQLLERFYDPQSGSIFIDGKNIMEYNLQWLRGHIGIVSQEPVLFHGTIRENILFGFDSASDEDIIQAAQMANAHEFIMAFPRKYDTEVGERGMALSGGQKQRIAIARALLRNPKILILDEATSALDTESEKVVQEALERAAQGRTTIIIAHRLSTIRHVDRIIVIEKGEIVEQGDHQTLMNLQGTYFSLVQRQISHQIEQTEDLEFEQEEKSRMILLKNRKGHYDKLEMNHERTAQYDKDSKKMKTKKRNVTLSMLRMNRPEWIFLIIGLLTSCLNGARESFYGIIQTKLTTVFQECDVHLQKQRIPLYILLYIGLAVISSIFVLIQNYVFGRSGEALTKRLRSKAFQSILRQDISYFNETEHSTGALCTRLATEASAIPGASGIRIGLIVQYLCSMGIGVIIGFVYCWQLTFLMLVFMPFTVFGGILQIQLASRFAKKEKFIFENAGQITLESIENIRTVVQLSKEDYFYDRYTRILDKLYQTSLKRTHIMSIVFSVSNSMFYFALASFISFSTHLMENETITFQNGFMILNCVVLTARTIGRTLTFFPDYGKALAAAENIFQLLDRQPTIDNQSKDGEIINHFKGELHFDGVYFAYPNRSESTILQNFELHIHPGQKVALVGASGCGKSTIIHLIERFYDVDRGRLLVDSKDVRNVDLHWYRSQIGIVSQEPVLFDVSIRENIAYGDNNRKEIPLDEIIQAAKDANIDHFIQSLPQGYETICGAKGIQLSGGQKQRVAIARALIRNPKILLLDEATSALDSENEKIVQEALDRAQQNRTSITIAHRLTTIQNADVIYVLHRGMIVESGNHEELMAFHGRYYRLVQGKLQ